MSKISAIYEGLDKWSNLIKIKTVGTFVFFSWPYSYIVFNSSTWRIWFQYGFGFDDIRVDIDIAGGSDYAGSLFDFANVNLDSVVWLKGGFW